MLMTETVARVCLWVRLSVFADKSKRSGLIYR